MKTGAMLFGFAITLAINEFASSFNYSTISAHKYGRQGETA